MTADKLSELLARREELHSDLQKHVVAHPSLGKVLQHPLAYQVLYLPELNAMINANYQYKLRDLAAARKAKDWNRIIALHERPYRWDALDSIAHQMSPKELAQSFAWCWTDSENIWQSLESISDLIQQIKHPGLRPYLMEADDLAHFQTLPESIQVYRGCLARNKSGLSWTQDRDKAQWFAKRLTRSSDQPLLLTGDVSKDDVLFYTNARNEAEIIACDLRAVTSIKQEILP